MGQLRKRGNVWWIRYYRNGRRHEESSGGTKKQAAIDLLKIREGDVAKGVPVSAKVGQLRFNEAAADLLHDYRANGRRSVKEVEGRVRLHLAPCFGRRRMSSITTPDIRAYVAQRQEAMASNASINRELAALKRMFSLAIEGSKLLFCPKVPMLEERNVRTGFFEHDQFTAVRAALPDPLKPIVTFDYLTGWRIPSEVLPLQWRQIDRERGIVRLDPGTTKNDSGRIFPYGELLPEFCDVMERQWEVTKQIEQERGIVCPWVFHRHGRRITDFRGAWAKAVEQAGCPDRIPHDFRRTAVRNLVRAGVPENVAMMLTGHKTRSVFDRYDIVDENDLREAVERLAASLAQGRKGKGSRRVRPFKRVTGTIAGTID